MVYYMYILYICVYIYILIVFKKPLVKGYKGLRNSHRQLFEHLFSIVLQLFNCLGNCFATVGIFKTIVSTNVQYYSIYSTIVSTVVQYFKQLFCNCFEFVEYLQQLFCNCFGIVEY